MMIDIDVSQLDGIVRAWLKDTLQTIEGNLNHMYDNYVHPDDVKEYRKDIKAIKRMLEYIGENG
jgi:hypothetical protein